MDVGVVELDARERSGSQIANPERAPRLRQRRPAKAGLVLRVHAQLPPERARDFINRWRSRIGIEGTKKEGEYRGGRGRAWPKG
jgi:hypothetical protein